MRILDTWLHSLHRCAHPRGAGVLRAELMVLSLTSFLAANPQSHAAVQGGDGVRNAPLAAGMVPAYPMRAKEFTLIQEGDYFHLFWMRHEEGVPDDSTERDLGHAVSRDLVNWDQLPPILPLRPGMWDDFHIWAPMVFKSGNTFYMYYTGVTRVPYGWNTFQRIGLATSTDLMNWTRTDQPVLSGAMIPWVFSDSSVFEGCQFRDPFAMPDPTTPGRTLLYFVATPASAASQLIVGVAQTTDLLNFSDVGPMWATDAAHYWGWCESPHMVEHEGLYYLFATTTSGHSLSYRVATSPLADSSEWSDRYRIFDRVDGDPASDYWFGSEVLSTPGHDYLAVINASGYWIAIYEIAWGVAPFFTLITPTITAEVATQDAVARLSLSRISPVGPGPGVMFRASMPSATRARVDLFDVGGRRVRTLHNGVLPRGETVLAWDGNLDDGARAGSGIYFASLETPLGRRVARFPVIH